MLLLNEELFIDIFKMTNKYFLCDVSLSKTLAELLTCRVDGLTSAAIMQV